MDTMAMFEVCQGIVTEMRAISEELDKLMQSLSDADEKAGEDDVEAVLFDEARKEVRTAQQKLADAQNTLAQYVGASMLLRS